MDAVGDLTSPGAASTVGRVLVVPVGATEQHGPHLPLQTDTLIAEALAGGLAAAAPDIVVVAPSIPYGSSGEHQSFAGTLSIGGVALRIMLVELCRSATYTWPRVLLLSTHGGNQEAVAAATAALRRESRDVVSWSPNWEGDLHAGYTETSIMLFLDRDAVGPHETVVGASGTLTDLLPVMRQQGLAAVSPSGVLGDARRATAAVGERLLRAAVDELVSVVEIWE